MIGSEDCVKSAGEQTNLIHLFNLLGIFIIQQKTTNSPLKSDFVSPNKGCERKVVKISGIYSLLIG